MSNGQIIIADMLQKFRKISGRGLMTLLVNGSPKGICPSNNRRSMRQNGSRINIFIPRAYTYTGLSGTVK